MFSTTYEGPASDAAAAFVESAKAQIGDAPSAQQEHVLESIGEGLDSLFGEDADTIEASVTASGSVEENGSFTLSLSVAAQRQAADTASDAASSSDDASPE